ncbi:MAG: hypothetical protein Q4A21_01935 [bacterium]|nr:hypothetical protein [bacterium]
MKKYSNKLYCFSPGVMLVTFLFEVFAAGVALFRYKNSETRRLIVYILLALAGFQAAEFMVCGGFGWTGVEWARFGYAAITLLPPLGLHLTHKIAGRESKKLVPFAYFTMIAFIVYYIFVTNGVALDHCRANYSVFNVPQIASWIYGLYYYGWMIAAIFIGFNAIKSNKNQEWNLPTNRISALKYLMFGYLAFILPTTYVNIIDPQTIEGIPSIMCGFAIIMAIVLLVSVAPRVLEKKSK